MKNLQIELSKGEQWGCVRKVKYDGKPLAGLQKITLTFEVGSPPKCNIQMIVKDVKFSGESVPAILELSEGGNA